MLFNSKPKQPVVVTIFLARGEPMGALHHRRDTVLLYLWLDCLLFEGMSPHSRNGGSRSLLHVYVYGAKNRVSNYAAEAGSTSRWWE